MLSGVCWAGLTTRAQPSPPFRKINSGAPVTMRQLRTDLGDAWRHPGTRLGLWTHFTTQFTGTVFALMWGFPFLIAG